MPSLKLCLPPSIDSLARQYISLEIKSTVEFDQHLHSEREDRKKNAGVGRGEPFLFTSVSSSDSVDEAGLAVEDSTDDEEGREIERFRQEALEILEGKRAPVPDRDYTGFFAGAFRDMYREEKLKNYRTNIPRNAAVPAPLLRGWRFLHYKLFGHSADAEAQGILPWDCRQRAYLLRLRKVNKRWCVEGAQNINACSVYKLLELMKEVEERGFRDVIRVMYPCSVLENHFAQADFDGARAVTWGDF